MSYSISVYLVYAFFCGRIQMVKGGAPMQMLRYEGGGGDAYPDLELKRRDSFRP